MEKRTKKILLAIFIATIMIRLVLAFLIPNFTYESYFHLRQIEHITETGFPLYDDPLSYGGREHLFLPFFHYFMAVFNLILPLTIIAKIIPNILIASITITTFLISKKITENDTASLLSALIAGFLPILFYTNSFTIETLFLPVTFVTIYAFLNIRKEIDTHKSKNTKENLKQRKFLYIYIFSFLILSITSSLAFLIIIGFGIYFLLSLLEGKRINKAELEVIIFSSFFFLWMQFIFFKNALLQEGISFVWHNVPSGALIQYFPKLSLLQALLLVSIIPFVTGIFVVYKSLFKLKNQKAFLLISFVISTTFLTWLSLISFKQSLAFFGVILAILFASFYVELNKYFKKTKLSHYKNSVLPTIIVLLLISTVIPAINAALNQDIPTEEEITAFKWINENTPRQAMVLATLEEGHLLTYYSHRKNMMDDQFRLIEDVDKRFKDLTSLYTTYFQTQALSLAEEYNLNYFVLTPSAKEKYDLRKFNYATKSCVRPVYTNETNVYLIRCGVKEIENKESKD